LPGAQLNPRYCEQLRALLAWPQSCGLLGGRPSSSLLFVGAQGGHVLFLDPHEVQEVRACNACHSFCRVILCAGCGHEVVEFCRPTDADGRPALLP